IDLARQQPTDEQSIADMRGINAPKTKKYYKTWLECINKGLSLPQDECPKINHRKKPTANQDKIIDILMTALNIRADELGITPAVVTTRKKVVSMVQEKRKTLSDDWRGALVNDLFNDILCGDKILTVEKGKAVILDR
ncbi:MAG: hypothetical protein KAG34_12475, partial [Cocleimonas sp.]|nr:hypothetical protein [Cocleimonas sp.]